MRTAILFAFIFLVNISGATGQVLYDWEARAENFHYRVKNIEFFIDRFNNQPEGSGSARAENPKDTVACLTFMKERDAKMFSLFDLGRLDKKDAKTRQTIHTFFRTINSPYDPRFIHFDDPDWLAEVTFLVNVKGQQKELGCVLQVTKLGQGALGWVIRSFHATSWQPDEYFSSNHLVFPPAVNGTDFMNVRLSLGDPAWLKEHLAISGVSSRTLQSLLEGNLRIEHVTNITYHFLQLEGWIMTVNYVDREAKNSGWLVNTVFPTTAADKAKYLKRLYAD